MGFLFFIKLLPCNFPCETDAQRAHAPGGPSWRPFKRRCDDDEGGANGNRRYDRAPLRLIDTVTQEPFIQFYSLLESTECAEICWDQTCNLITLRLKDNISTSVCHDIIKTGLDLGD